MLHIKCSRASLIEIAGRIASLDFSDKKTAQIFLKTSPANEGQIFITSQDPYQKIFLKTESLVFSEGQLALPAKLFCDVIMQTYSPDIELKEEDGNLLKISSNLAIEENTKNGFSFKIPIHHDVTMFEFPDLEALCEQGKFLKAEFDPKSLLRMFEEGAYCVSEKNPRPYSQVCRFHRHDSERYRVVSTDAYRLAFCERKAKFSDELFFMEENKKPSGVNLSSQVILAIKKMCSLQEESIKLFISKENTSTLALLRNNQVSFFSTKALSFPNYDNISLPNKKPSISLIISKNQLLNTLKRTLIANEKSWFTRFNWTPTSLTLSSRSEMQTESSDTVSLTSKNYIEEPKEKDFEFFLDGQLLREILTSLSSDEVLIQLFNEQSSTLIQPYPLNDEVRSLHTLVFIKETIA